MTEANNKENDMYGEERLKDYLNAHCSDSYEDMLKGLRDDISAFADGAEQSDDITMLVLEYKGNGAGEAETGAAGEECSGDSGAGSRADAK